MITNDDILEVRLYEKKFIKSPCKTDTKTIFQKKCYQSWCVDSIVERLYFYATIDPEMQVYDVCYNLTPIDIIEEFKADMEFFLEKTTFETGIFIFSTAIDECDSLLNYLERMQNEKLTSDQL
uniref:Uncharacterized protein n=1 Tax=Siphoviridae sp. ctWWc42 TaxID=2826361 RepID=A0A8S5R1L8_9CAUD|nr:MAG TPA: hypothetical protein [Siphoviridae sp. ctWWc42]